jgi:hypothetical protein
VKVLQVGGGNRADIADDVREKCIIGVIAMQQGDHPHAG